jgi:hypothetical protein
MTKYINHLSFLRYCNRKRNGRLLRHRRAIARHNKRVYYDWLRYSQRKRNGMLARHRRAIIRHSKRVAASNRAYARKRLADKRYVIRVLVLVPTLALIAHMLMTLLSV